MKHFAVTLNRTLRWLGKNSSDEHDPFVKSVDEPDWQFLFNKASFFITTFAPCYPLVDGRTVFGDDTTIIFFNFSHRA